MILELVSSVWGSAGVEGYGVAPRALTVYPAVQARGCSVLCCSGDEPLPAAECSRTHPITIRAPPEEIGPRLAQTVQGLPAGAAATASKRRPCERGAVVAELPRAELADIFPTDADD